MESKGFKSIGEIIEAGDLLAGIEAPPSSSTKSISKRSQKRVEGMERIRPRNRAESSTERGSLRSCSR